MTTDVSDAVAAPTTVVLGGDEYQLPPLTDVEFGKFERWLRSEEIRIAAELAEVAVTEEQRQVILKNGSDRAAELHINHPRALASMVSFQGSTYLLWLNLIRRHPNLTLEKVRKMCEDPEAMKRAYDAMDAMVGKDERVESLPANGSTSERSTGVSPASTDGAQSE